MNFWGCIGYSLLRNLVFIGMFSLLLMQGFRKSNIKFKIVFEFVVEAIFWVCCVRNIKGELYTLAVLTNPR